MYKPIFTCEKCGKTWDNKTNWYWHTHRRQKPCTYKSTEDDYLKKNLNLLSKDFEILKTLMTSDNKLTPKELEEKKGKVLRKIDTLFNIVQGSARGGSLQGLLDGFKFMKDCINNNDFSVIKPNP